MRSDLGVCKQVVSGRRMACVADGHGRRRAGRHGQTCGQTCHSGTCRRARWAGKSHSMINLEINGYKTLRETYLGLVTTELSVAVCKTLKMDRELDVLDELAVPSD